MTESAVQDITGLRGHLWVDSIVEVKSGRFDGNLLRAWTKIEQLLREQPIDLPLITCLSEQHAK